MVFSSHVRARRSYLAFHTLVVASAAAAAGTFFAAPAIAADVRWTSSAGGVFGAASNWNSGSGPVPGTGDVADFRVVNSGAGPTYTVTFASDPTNQGLVVHRDKVTFNLAGHTYTITGTPGVDAFIVASKSGETGVLTLSGGTLITSANSTAYQSVIAHALNSTGTVNLNSGTWIDNAVEYVGESGTGTINQSGGNHTLASNLLLGVSSGAHGTYNLYGGSLFGPYSATLVIGNSGTGAFSQSGGDAEFGTVTLGQNSGANGVLTINDPSGQASFYADRITVGAGGNGILSLINGSIQTYSSLIINPSGTVNLSGGVLTSLATVASSGVFNMSGGTLDLGRMGGLNVAGGQFNWTGGTIQGWDAYLTFDAVALTLGPSQSISAPDYGTEVIGNYSGGTLTQTGGINAPDSELRLGRFAGSSGVYLLSGGTLSMRGADGFDPYVVIGGNGSGYFLQTGGVASFASSSYFSTTSIFVGPAGTLTLNDPSGQATFTAGPFTDNGILNVQGGIMTLGSLGISGTNAIVNLSGGTLAVSTLNTNGTPSKFHWTGGTFLVTGTSGLFLNATGPLGASLTLLAAQTLGVTNILTLASASTLTLNGGAVNANSDVHVAETGTATFNHSSGTHTFASNLILGVSSGAVGTYNLYAGDLVGGRWGDAGTLYIGYSGNGAFIQSGGGIGVDTIILGQYPGSNGTLTVNQPTGAAVIGGHLITVGAGGHGVFNLINGTVSLATYGPLHGLALNPTGTLNMSGGVLNTPITSSGVFNMSGGTLYLGLSTLSVTGGQFNWTGGSILGEDANIFFDNVSLTLGPTQTIYSESYGFERIGINGNATLTQTGGLNLTDSEFELGVNTGSCGVYLLSGGTLTMRGPDGFAPHVVIGGSGSGYFLQTGGLASFASGSFFSSTSIIVGPAGTLTLNDPSGHATFTAGPLNDNGILNVQGGVMSLGSLGISGANAIVNLSGGTLAVSTLNTNGTPSKFHWTGGTFLINGTSGLLLGATGPLGASLTLLASQTLGVSNTFTLAAGSSLTLNGGILKAASLDVCADPSCFHWTCGTLCLTAGAIAGCSIITIPSAGKLSFSGGVPHAIPAVCGSGALEVDTATTLTSDGINLPTGSLTIAGAQIIRSSAAPAYTKFATGHAADALSGTSKIAASGLTITGNLGIKNNALIIEPANAATRQATMATLATTTLGSKITSSTAATSTKYTLAIIDNSRLGAANFGGVAVDSNSVIVTEALKGDASMDGLVNTADLLVWKNNFNATSVYTQLRGDFNGDGLVNTADLLVWKNNFNASISTNPAPSDVSTDRVDTLDGPAITGGATPNTVPEPASLPVLALATLATLCRRQRRIPASF